MKKHYETPSVQIEKFDLEDPDIFADSAYSDNTDIPWYYSELTNY